MHLSDLQFCRAVLRACFSMRSSAIALKDIARRTNPISRRSQRWWIKVLPDFLSVLFDPTKKRVGSTDLNGWYLYDDEGVKARPVKVVENGTLKTFLMSRSPIKGFPQSNGHGRKQAGSGACFAAVESYCRIVSKQVSECATAANAGRRDQTPGQAVRILFRARHRRLHDYGRSSFQSFKVIPLVVYRVYPDGRPDELVRGVDIVGTPLASFARILATSDKPEVFNGYCGAESGSVPVSAVSPAILVSELEIQKKAKGRDRPPLLPAPPSSTPATSGGAQ